MGNNAKTDRKTVIGTGIMFLVLAAVQAPLWRPPDMPQYVNAGQSVAIRSHREIKSAGILQRKMATLSMPNTHEVDIHGHASGITEVYVWFKDGQTSIYRVIVRDPAAHSHDHLLALR